MASIAFAVKSLPALPDATAPDGSQVRTLCASRRGSMAHFTLPPGGVSKPVAHRTVEEIWYVVGGRGRIWRRLADREEVIDIAGGVSLAIPTGTAFQFRNDGESPLEILGVTMPPWPGGEEAYPVEGKWPASV